MFGIGREALPDVRKALRMSRSGRESPPDVWEFLEGRHGYPGVVGMPSRMFGSVQKPTRMPGRPTQMSRSGREALTVVWECSGVPPRCSGVVGSPSRMSASVREAPRMYGSGWEALPDD